MLHAFGIGALLRLRDDTVAIEVDTPDHRRKHGDARYQPDMGFDAISVDRDRGRLKILVEPMGARLRRKRQQNGAGRDSRRAHFDAGLRP